MPPCPFHAISVVEIFLGLGFKKSQSCMFFAPRIRISPFSQEPSPLQNVVERSQSDHASLGTKSIGLLLVVHFVCNSYVLSFSA